MLGNEYRTVVIRGKQNRGPIDPLPDTGCKIQKRVGIIGPVNEGSGQMPAHGKWCVTVLNDCIHWHAESAETSSNTHGTMVKDVPALLQQ